LAVAALLLGTTAPAAAVTASASGLEAHGPEVDDATLGQMRGKFLLPGNITYFGIEMQTSLQRSDGITTAATVQLTVDLPNGTGTTSGANAQLLVSWNHDGDSSMDVAGTPAGATLISIPAGLASVQGAVQSQQIAGSDNKVSNAMSIAIMPTSSVNPPSGAGLTAATGGETHSFSNGDTLQIVADKNQLGIVVGNGADQVRQMVDGGVGQAAQNVILNSSGNIVSNGMGITIGFDPAQSAAQAATIQSNLTALKGWSF
jgi:hypothetical protein